MSRLILLIIFFLLFYLVLRYLLKGTMGPMAKKEKGSEPEELVQDPYCQTYFPKKLGIKKKIEGRTLYFCKEECLKKYLRNIKKEGISQSIGGGQ